jgi:hypothetical protein
LFHAIADVADDETDLVASSLNRRENRLALMIAAMLACCVFAVHPHP